MPGVEYSDGAGVGRAGLEVEAQLVQPVLQVARGLVLAEADLRILVEVAAQVDDVIQDGRAG